MAKREYWVMSLDDFITETKVQSLAGGTYFARGLAYLKDGYVLKMEAKDNYLKANVRGSYGSYLVSLGIKKNILNYSCSCPLGENGEFCKHLVASCLKFLEEKSNQVKFVQNGNQVGNKDVRKLLEKMQKKQLVDLIFDFAQNNSELREQLKIMVASGSETKGAATFKKALDNAFYIDDFIKYNEVYDYCHGIELVVDALKKALDQGYFDVVMEATEHGLSYIEEVINAADSEYELHDIFQELFNLHIQAYKKSDFDPEQMAKRLLLWEINDDYGIFEISDSYIELLDKKCKHKFFELAKAEWDKLPPLKPGAREEYGGPRYQLTNMMENIAQKSNNLQELIAIKSKDLSCEYSYLNIAEECRKAKDFKLALKWAEDGVKAFKKNCDERLLDFLADEYHRLKRHNEAMKIAWRIFEQSSYLSGYKSLAAHAKKAKCWDTLRPKAIDCIRKEIEAGKKKKQSYFFKQDSSRLVEILIWEKRYEEAWNEANTGGCNNSLWMSLASIRSKSHPADSVEIYRRHVPGIIEQTNNKAYVKGVALLKTIRECMNRLNQEAEFKNYCDSLRLQYKAKRNFIKEMNKAKL